jgi:hypothetical protein
VQFLNFNVFLKKELLGKEFAIISKKRTSSFPEALEKDSTFKKMKETK